MIKRKKTLIDKKFQLRTTFIVISASAALLALIITAMTATILIGNARMKKIIEFEDDIVYFITTKPQKTDDAGYRDVLKDVAEKHAKNAGDIKSNMRANDIILVCTLIIAIVGELLLFMGLIIITHRISGPIYVMSNYLQSIIDGQNPRMRDLRKNDELKEFYSLFKKMVDTRINGK